MIISTNTVNQVCKVGPNEYEIICLNQINYQLYVLKYKRFFFVEICYTFDVLIIQLFVHQANERQRNTCQSSFG